MKWLMALFLCGGCLQQHSPSPEEWAQYFQALDNKTAVLYKVVERLDTKIAALNNVLSEIYEKENPSFMYPPVKEPTDVDLKEFEFQLEPPTLNSSYITALNWHPVDEKPSGDLE